MRHLYTEKESIEYLAGERTTDSMLQRYLCEIGEYPVLSRDEELALARDARERNSKSAAQRLIACNLRFVVKTAKEFRGYGFRLLDLIQEGSLGLTVAVSKFDYTRGYRLVTYAVWWIRAYMQKFIMQNWSQVKIGTTQNQRKLFFRVRAERERADRRAHGGTRAEASELAAFLGVKEAEVTSMEQRLARHDFSLDTPLLADGTDTCHLDTLADAAVSPEAHCADQQMRRLLRVKLGEVARQLNSNEKQVVARRILRDDPETLLAIGQGLGISRERVRQIESNILQKIRAAIGHSDKFLVA